MIRRSATAVVFALLAAACGASVDAAAESATTAEPVSAPSCTDSHKGRETFQYRELSAEELSDEVEVNDVSLDVWASPNAQDCPIVVWVHGGSWVAGGKLTQLTREVKAPHFIESGHVFVSINYRLASETNDIRWPVFGDDVAAATDWVIENAELIGGDPDRVSLIGHSAGAHLVSIVGTNPQLLENHGRTPGDVACVVSLDSVTHVLNDPPPWEVDIIELAFPSEEQQIDGSPTLQAQEHADANSPDYLIVTRGRDPRIESSELLAATLNERGATATVADVSPYDHSQVSAELGVDGEMIVTPVVDEFLAGCNA